VFGTFLRVLRTLQQPAATLALFTPTSAYSCFNPKLPATYILQLHIFQVSGTVTIKIYNGKEDNSE
jgi:hypothetical protein